MLSILDVGSMAKEEQDTYRPLFGPPRYSFTGLDLTEGPNVDLVPADVFSWSEIPSQSFDVVISGQVLEHNPYFWITFAEIARVLVEGGLVAIVAPGTGPVHRYPFDCWRFYPDAWPAACEYVGLELIEHSMEAHPPHARMSGFDWSDNFLVARAPAFAEAAPREDHYRRLAAIVATRASMPEIGPEVLAGPALSLYERRRDDRCPPAVPSTLDPTKEWMGAMVADGRARYRTLRRRLRTTRAPRAARG